MASKRGAGIVLSLILTYNVLCTDVSRADDSVSCIIESKNFVKKKGYINSTDIRYLVTMNKSLGVNYCHDSCHESCLCIAYQPIPIENRHDWCAFYWGILDFIEDSSSMLEIYMLHIDGKTEQPHAPASRSSPGMAHMSAGPSPMNPQGRNAKKRWLIWHLVAAAFAIAIGLVAVTCYFRRKEAKSSGIHALKDEKLDTGNLMITTETERRSSYTLSDTHKLDKSKKLGDEMQMFSFRSISTATNHFSFANKLGEGGFGPVYKGNLVDGQEIAVKRLSTSSSQGMMEFKNEMKLITQLQHTNLVRLLGCCNEGGEKMLVYEFLPHKSLDFFLFDSTKKKLLDWRKRLEIIEGIAQGLLYLHKYSRLKVIHRDLKTSNILLDSKMNPKISDFGLARIFEQNQSEAKTDKVVGTYGYMAPEYATEGFYSEKSDVFSFGIIILEIMSGKKTTSLSGTDSSLNIIGYSWDLWREGKSMELLDQTIGKTCSREELLRYVHVGLHCVEENVSDRPSMSDVIYMLTKSTVLLPAIKQPAFYNLGGKNDRNLDEHDPTSLSLNLVSMSPIEGR